MAERCLLHQNKLDLFKWWLSSKGYEIQATKGIYEVLRAKKDKDIVIIFKKDGAKEHLSIQHGYCVCSSDLIDRGYGEVKDFFSYKEIEKGIDIITNPPYKFAKEFVEHSLKITQNGSKIAMFLKLTFLEGKGRRELFKNNPPKTVYVSSARLQCGKNGCFDGTSMVAYAWFVWENGYKGDTIIKWIN